MPSGGIVIPVSEIGERMGEIEMRKTAIIVAATAAGVLAIGGAGAAVASQTDASTTPTGVQTSHRTGDDDRHGDRAGDRGDDQAVTGTPAVSRERAVRLAQARVPGARVTESGLDRENGVLIWEVDLVKNNVEYEVDVDATTAAIRKVDRERDRSDDNSDHRDDNHDD